MLRIIGILAIEIAFWVAICTLSAYIAIWIKSRPSSIQQAVKKSP
jgi:hypothetical protein